MTQTLTDITDEHYAKEIALRLATNVPILQISKDLGISRNKVNRIAKLDVCKKYLSELTSQSFEDAKKVIQKRSIALADVTMDTLEQQLKEGSMDAVKTNLKLLGFLKDEEKPQGDTSITVVMPGQSQPIKVNPDIEIE
jgi:hypothetical protein